jgi:hypothetical protein
MTSQNVPEQDHNAPEQVQDTGCYVAFWAVLSYMLSVLACSGVFWGCSGAFWAVLWYVECSGVFWSVLACVLGPSGLFYDMLNVLACSGVFWCVLGVFWGWAVL